MDPGQRFGQSISLHSVGATTPEQIELVDENMPQNGATFRSLAVLSQV